MNNIVDFRTGRSRPRRSIPLSQDGAQILFFTGVRYLRESDDEVPPFAAEPAFLARASDQGPQLSSEFALDLAAH